MNINITIEPGTPPARIQAAMRWLNLPSTQNYIVENDNQHTLHMIVPAATRHDAAIPGEVLFTLDDSEPGMGFTEEFCLQPDGRVCSSEGGDEPEATIYNLFYTHCGTCGDQVYWTIDPNSEDAAYRWTHAEQKRYDHDPLPRTSGIGNHLAKYAELQDLEGLGDVGEVLFIESSEGDRISYYFPRGFSAD